MQKIDSPKSEWLILYQLFAFVLYAENNNNFKIDVEIFNRFVI